MQREMPLPGEKAGSRLQLKVWIFSLAAILALAGMYLDQRWMTGVALAVLATSMFLRFMPSADTEDEDEDEDEEAVSGM